LIRLKVSRLASAAIAGAPWRGSPAVGLVGAGRGLADLLKKVWALAGEIRLPTRRGLG
jgi:hypothetical protein